MRNVRPDVMGWLQDVYEKAQAIHDGIYEGTLSSCATVHDDWDLEDALRSVHTSLERYERACNGRAIAERDPGPSQAQRL